MFKVLLGWPFHVGSTAGDLRPCEMNQINIIIIFIFQVRKVILGKATANFFIHSLPSYSLPYFLNVKEMPLHTQLPVIIIALSSKAVIEHHQPKTSIIIPESWNYHVYKSPMQTAKLNTNRRYLASGSSRCVSSGLIPGLAQWVKVG